jgi:hypothetical protein
VEKPRERLSTTEISGNLERSISVPIKTSAEHSDRHRNVRFLDQFADKIVYDYSVKSQRKGPSDSSDTTGVIPTDPTEGINL